MLANLFSASLMQLPDLIIINPTIVALITVHTIYNVEEANVHIVHCLLFYIYSACMPAPLLCLPQPT